VLHFLPDDEDDNIPYNMPPEDMCRLPLPRTAQQPYVQPIRTTLKQMREHAAAVHAAAVAAEAQRLQEQREAAAEAQQQKNEMLAAAAAAKAAQDAWYAAQDAVPLSPLGLPVVDPIAEAVTTPIQYTDAPHERLTIGDASPVQLEAVGFALGAADDAGDGDGDIDQIFD
jgi:hypothetical protein